jgi:thioredoxin reductase (NADPH)
VAEFQPHDGPGRAPRRIIEANRVLLATGAEDVEPQLPDLPDAIRRGLVRYCPICDGYEARGRRVAVLGHGDHGLAEAVFIARTYSCDVTLLTLGQALKLSDDQRAKVDEYKIKIVEAPISALAIEGDKIGALRTADGAEYRFDTLYSALGLRYRSELAAALGAERAPSGALLVDDHNQTTIKDLYAAGDVVSGLDQIAVALGHAAVAATRIHNRCELPTDAEGGSRRSVQPP